MGKDHQLQFLFTSSMVHYYITQLSVNLIFKPYELKTKCWQFQSSKAEK